MAERKTSATKNEDVEEIVENNSVEQELNLDAKVTVVNLANWKVTFSRLQDGYGDVLITENGRTRLSRNEIVAQVNNGNKLFVGVDGNGSHATIYIEDAPTREWVGFEDKKNTQMIFSEKLVKQLFNMSQKDYEEKLPVYIRTRAEKHALMEAIKKLNLNDYRKIMYASQYTGYKI